METEPYQTDKTVWPPPPLNAFSPTNWFAFRSLGICVEGKPAAFQRGQVSVKPAGITIEGKMPVRNAGQIPLILACIAYNHQPHRIALYFSAAAAAYVLVLTMVYFFRSPHALMLSWSEVRQVVLDEEKHRASISYDAPDHAGKTKTYSLAFALKMPLYLSFVSAVDQYAPSRRRLGKLRGEDMTVPLMLVLHIFVVLALAFLLSRLIMGH